MAEKYIEEKLLFKLFYLQLLKCLPHSNFHLLCCTWHYNSVFELIAHLLSNRI